MQWFCFFFSFFFFFFFFFGFLLIFVVLCALSSSFFLHFHFHSSLLLSFCLLFLLFDSSRFPSFRIEFLGEKDVRLVETSTRISSDQMETSQGKEGGDEKNIAKQETGNRRGRE